MGVCFWLTALCTLEKHTVLAGGNQKKLQLSIKTNSDFPKKKKQKTFDFCNKTLRYLSKQFDLAQALISLWNFRIKYRISMRLIQLILHPVCPRWGSFFLSYTWNRRNRKVLPLNRVRRWNKLLHSLLTEEIIQAKLRRISLIFQGVFVIGCLYSRLIPDPSSRLGPRTFAFLPRNVP